MEAAQMKDDAALGKYFAMMLHIDDDDLDPFEYKLLGHYRKIAGLYRTDTIFESNETTAKAAKMTVAKMRAARRELAKKGCIKVEDRNGRTLIVHLVDRMAENTQRYSKSDPYQNRKGYQNQEGTPIEIVRSDVTISTHDSIIEESEESNTSLQGVAVAPPAEVKPEDDPVVDTLNEGIGIQTPPTLPDKWVWLCSSVHGTLAHAVPKGKEKAGRTACGAPLMHRTSCSAPIGNRAYCLDCQHKAIDPPPKQPSIDQVLKDAIAVHVQKIKPELAGSLTGTLAQLAAGVWRKRLGIEKLSAEQYAAVARSIPIFVQWYTTVCCPGMSRPTKPDTFENRYSQFPPDWRPGQTASGQTNMAEYIPDPDNPSVKITRAQLATRERNKKLIEAEYGTR